jgi:hypothetical protein
MFVSCFYFFYSYFVYLHFFLFLCIYLFIYLFSFFFFKNILFFLICSIMKRIYFLNYIFVWLDAGPPVFPKDFFNRNGTSRGPPTAAAWPPCPALFVTSSTANGQWLEESSRHCPIFVHTGRRTDTMFAFIYKIANPYETPRFYCVHSCTRVKPYSHSYLFEWGLSEVILSL